MTVAGVAKVACDVAGVRSLGGATEGNPPPTADPVLMANNLSSNRLFDDRQLRLDTLVRLRWLAVAGQTVAILVVHVGLGFPVPLAFSFALIALSAWLNLFLKVSYASMQRLPERWASVLLGYDIMQLAGLLYLTGGLGNPFAFLLVAPVMVSATALPPRYTLVLGGVATLAATFLALFQMPLPWRPGETFELPLLYQFAVWAALLCSLAFMAIYAFRVAEEARLLAQALSATELVLAREQHLSALDGLAAAAAHELGTPLATMVLTAKELEGEIDVGDPRHEDAALIRSQGERCREILRKLTSLSSDEHDAFFKLPLSHLVDEIAAPHRDFGIAIHAVEEGEGEEPSGRRNPAVLYGLGNLVENAVDFAKSEVRVETFWNAEIVSLAVIDDGPGFSMDVIGRIGEPYVTTRSKLASRAAEPPSEPAAGGLGLGFFIAKTLLERTGARLTLENRRAPDSGAIVRVAWPRKAFEQGPGFAQNES